MAAYQFVLVLFVVAGTASSLLVPPRRPSHRTRIIDGEDARPGEFPWQVSLQMPQFESPIPYKFCGGVIINTRTVLTAGHCFYDEDGQPIPANTVTVVAGLINIDNPEGPGQSVRVSSVRINPFHDLDTYDNDLAVVTLTTPLSFNDKVNSIPMASPDSVPSGVCTAVGWGDIGEPWPADVLQKVDLDAVDRVRCRSLWQAEDGDVIVTDGMVCANRPYKGTCHGDSGSGFICKNSSGQYYLAGLVSWGQNDPECAFHPELPSVFTNVAHYRGWIGL